MAAAAVTPASRPATCAAGARAFSSSAEPSGRRAGSNPARSAKIEQQPGEPGATGVQDHMNESIFRRQSSLEALNALSAGTAMEPLGIVFTELGPDYLRATMPVDARTRQPFGLLHGGASVLLAETLGSSASMLCIGEDELCVGIEINANHLSAVRDGSVTGTARPLHVGRRTLVWEIRIEDDAGRLACISRLTVAVIAKRG